MTGVIWSVQLVQYPLFSSVGTDQFPLYHDRYTHLITWIVGPAMMVELGSALFIVGASYAVEHSLVAIVVLILVWLSTALIQVPCHTNLSHGFDARIHRKLVLSNWVRTIGWSVRSLIALSWLIY